MAVFFRFLFKWVVYGFAMYGFILCATYFAVRLGLTKTDGSTDKNNRYFTELTNRQSSVLEDSDILKRSKFLVYHRLLLLHDFYPKNAQAILKAYHRSGSEAIAIRMLDAADLRLKSNTKYLRATKDLLERLKKSNRSKNNLYEWMNSHEWKVFKQAVVKDSLLVDSVSNLTGVEPRLIVSCLVGEQMRLFNSKRERFKTYIEPLKTLGMGSNFSYGIAGIKDFTAKRIETNLKDKKSVFYLGSNYEHLLDYDTLNSKIEENKFNDTLDMRLKRLVQFNNHYYSYLYTALFIKQIRQQWLNAGFPIDTRPEIFASLFNLGFQKSVPKKNPAVGGSVYEIAGKNYTFGAVAFEFFYSGELQNTFPFKTKSFDF
ncbi:MAG: hypothetical protein KJ941_02005 [Bacteroidetes bacterium]|nr:hypothetical protein [Bacteroidota bacterium]